MTRGNGIAQRLTCIGVAAVLALGSAGCANVPGGARSTTTSTGVPLTPAEQKLRADSERFDNTVIGGVIKGAAIGALVGAATRAAQGGNRTQVAQGAVAGAVVGGAIGGVQGYVTAKKQQAKMDEVAAIQSAAADVREDNGKLQAFLASSATVLQEGQQRLAAIKGDVEAKRITTAQADAARKREEQNIAQMKTTLAKARETQTQYVQASATFQGPPAAKRDLDAEIARMNRQVAELERNINTYTGYLAVSKA